MPEVLVFAGANGSGKTTLARTVLQKRLKYINADAIKQKEKLSYLQAGQAALERIDQSIAWKMSFSFETTMSGLGLHKRFEAMKACGYRIQIFYLFAFPLDLLHARIQERFRKGGHFVEPEDVIRRFYRSAVNFWTRYRKFADEWVIVNNNEFRYENVALGHQDHTDFSTIDPGKMKSFLEVVKRG